MNKNNKIYLLIASLFSLFLLSMNLCSFLDIISFAIIESSFLIFALCFVLSREAEVTTAVVIDDEHIHFVFEHCNEFVDVVPHSIANFKAFVFEKKRKIDNLRSLFSNYKYLIIKNFLVELFDFLRKQFYKIIFNYQIVVRDILPVRAGPYSQNLNP